MKINDKLSYEMMNNKLIIINENDKIFSDSKALILSGVGLDIFNMLKKNVSVDKIVEKIVKTYNIEQQVAHNDTLEFIDNLIAKRVLLNDE